MNSWTWICNTYLYFANSSNYNLRWKYNRLGIGSSNLEDIKKPAVNVNHHSWPPDRGNFLKNSKPGGRGESGVRNKVLLTAPMLESVKVPPLMSRVPIWPLCPRSWRRLISEATSNKVNCSTFLTFGTISPLGVSMASPMLCAAFKSQQKKNISQRDWFSERQRRVAYLVSDVFAFFIEWRI